MSKKKIATAVAAGSVLLILSLIFFRGSIIPKAEKHELEELLSSKAGGVDVLISTEVKVGDRVARYTLELSEGSSMINRDTRNTYTLRSLSRYIGEKYCEMSYMGDNGEYTLTWYYPSSDFP